jgi:4-hydroxybenzoate polyprenyltransferase
MTQSFFILGFISTGIFFWRTFPIKFIAIIKNSRFERVMHYIALLCLGIGFAFITNNGSFFSWVDVLGVICLLISWYGAWMFAIHINDISDLKSDSVSNTNRPLVKKILSPEEIRESANIWLVISLLGSWSAGYYPLFMNIVYLVCSYVYSIDFLRFKRIPILSPLIIGIACLSSVLAGFFFLSIDKTFQIFPASLALGIVIIYTLGSNIRDLKDIDGDRIDNVYTIPVIFGEKIGRKIIGVMFGLSFLLVPFFVGYNLLYIISIPASVAGYFLVTKFPHREKYLFSLYFIYILFGVVLFF